MNFIQSWITGTLVAINMGLGISVYYTLDFEMYTILHKAINETTGIFNHTSNYASWTGTKISSYTVNKKLYNHLQCTMFDI